MPDNPYSDTSDSRQPLLSSVQVGQLRVAQVICGAMTFGVLILLGIGLVLIEGDLDHNTDLIVLIAAGFAVTAGLTHGVLASRFPSSEQLREYAQAENPAEPLARFFTQRLIVALAVLEGAAVMNAVVIMIFSSWVSVIAVACLVVMMVLRFPAIGSLRDFIDVQLQQLSMSESGSGR